MAEQKAAPRRRRRRRPPPAPAPPTRRHRRRRRDRGDGRAARAPRRRPPASLTTDVTPVMPEVADGIAVRWVDVAAPWLADVGGDPTSATAARPRSSPGSRCATTTTKADLVHDEEYEAVLYPLGEPVDVTTAIAVDYDDRDLRDRPRRRRSPTGSPDAPIETKAFWTQVSSATSSTTSSAVADV